MPATKLLRDMPDDEWPLWISFYGVQNLGPRGDDLRAGVIASALHNALCEEKAQPSDYFPSLRTSPKPRQPGERGRVDPGVRAFLGRFAPAFETVLEEAAH